MAFLILDIETVPRASIDDAVESEIIKKTKARVERTRDEYENADLYSNKGITIGVLKYKNHCKRVQDKIGMLKSRYNANQ